MKRKLAAVGAALALVGGAVFGTAGIAAAEDVVPPTDPVVVETVEEVIVPEPIVVEEVPVVVEDVPVIPESIAAPAPEALKVFFAAVEEPKYNDPAWWAANYAFTHEVVQCYKDSHGTTTNDDKAVTLYPYGADWPGDHYELLVVKAGSTDFGNGPGNLVYDHPSAGTPYFAPTGDNGKVKDVSHWIVCKGITPEVVPVEAKADYGYNPGTCTTGQSVVIDNANLTNATWTEESLAKNGTVGPAEFDISAVLNEGAVWAEGQTGNFHVVLLGPDDSQCPEIEVCETETVQPTSTNVNPQGWTLVGGEWVDGGVEFSASDWSDAYAAKDVNFPLSASANLDFDVTGGNVWAIILETTAGNVHYEPEPYTDDLWTNSIGILPANAGGQGGPYSGDLEDILSDPTVTKVKLYFTSGSLAGESAVLHSGSYNCLEQPFDHENVETPVPALFGADPLPPLCGVAGSFDFSGEFPNVTVTVTPSYEGPGEYLLEATTDAGYEFPDGSTYKFKSIVVLDALPFQSEDPQADCYRAPPVVPVGQTVVDSCGPNNVQVTAPADTESIDYTLTESGVLYAEAKEGFEIAEPGEGDKYTLFDGIATFEAPVDSNEKCPENVLAFTGNEGWPLGVAVGFLALLFGSLAVWFRREKAKQ